MNVNVNVVDVEASKMSGGGGGVIGVNDHVLVRDEDLDLSNEARRQYLDRLIGGTSRVD